ncbi:hypothetical protein SEA_APHELION_161 [Gordonia phage Aphelion]|uniref:Uncharacterized protein n=1 Tax=Gordonia phage Aphelion TaxID=2507860 RepID=A0A410TDB7_9CAUD|nr:hypothetical protein SEA_APHELION_161 [Gordonia phage Aphelion]
MNAQEIVEKFPGRDKSGYVVGWYLYTPRGTREGGPYPTYEEADSHRSAVFVQNIICGPVLTDRGMVVQTGNDEVAEDVYSALTDDQIDDMRSAAREYRRALTAAVGYAQLASALDFADTMAAILLDESRS